MERIKGKDSVRMVLEAYFRFSGEQIAQSLCVKPKTICTPSGIIPQNYSSLGSAVAEELRNKQTYTDTDILVLERIDDLLYTILPHVTRARMERFCKMVAI